MAVPVVTVEVAFSAGASTSVYLHLDDATRGLLDTGTLAPDAVWTDISDFVLGVSTNRGTRRIESPIIRYEPGTATIVLDNSDRRFDPANLSGPYVVAGVTQVTPMRAVRIRAIWAGVTYNIWRGFADEWRISYADPSWSQVILTATDAFKVVANFDRTAGAPVGAGEDTGSRIQRILDAMGWSATDRLIRFGDSALQATTLADNSLTELRLSAETEFGELYIDEAGRVYFRNRQATLTDARSNTAQATFGDGGGAELPYEQVEVAYDDASFINRALITRTGGTQQQADDSASQASYLIRTARRTDLLLQTDGEAADWARYIVRLAGQPELRFATMTVFPRESDANLFPQVLGRQIGDRLTVVRRPPGSRVYADAIIGDKPISYWRLDDSDQIARDLIGTNNGSLLGAVSVLRVPGAIADGNACMGFDDGSTGYINIPDSSTLHPPNLVSAEAWFYKTADVNNQSVLEGGASPNGSFEMSADTTGKMRWIIQITPSLVVLATSPNAIPLNQWTHAVGTWDGSNCLLYINGSLVASTTSAQTMQAGSGGMGIGSSAGGAGAKWNGLLDEVAIYGRPLTAQQILNHYNKAFVTPQTGGSPIVRDVFIRGIAHEIGDEQDWRTTWTLESATKYQFLILDHATLGQLDKNALGF